MAKTPSKVEPTGETRLHKVGHVQVYARCEAGMPTKVDAIDTDEAAIRRIADRLQARGFGVLRRWNPRAGKTYHLLKASWAGPGDPPENPFAGQG